MLSGAACEIGGKENPTEMGRHEIKQFLQPNSFPPSHIILIPRFWGDSSGNALPYSSEQR